MRVGDCAVEVVSAPDARAALDGNERFNMLNVAVSERRMAAHTASEQAPCSPAATRSTNFPLPLPARFLDASEAVGETVVLASYPRSGNSLLRSLLESISGVVTGSDTRADRTLSLALQECGVRGEGVIDERAWVVKSHYPERRGCARFAAKRAILLVRNPWDVIDSYFNMTLTNSHNTTMRDDQYARFEELFRGLARAEADVWARFNRWWLRAPIPLLVVRYEDLVHHRHRTLRRVAWFLRGCDPLEGTRWADRVDAACGAELDASGFYAPRRGGARRVGSSLRRFDDALRGEVEDICGSMLADFGYDAGRGFPETVDVAPRALRAPVPPGDGDHDVDGSGALVLNGGREVRPTSSKHGRYMTTFRKALREPVMAADGTCLNMHEVEAARERWRRKGRS